MTIANAHFLGVTPIAEHQQQQQQQQQQNMHIIAMDTDDGHQEIISDGDIIKFSEKAIRLGIKILTPVIVIYYFNNTF